MRLSIFLTAILGACILVSACSKKVEEYTVKKMDLDYNILANCTVAYPDPYDITAASAGEVKSIGAEEGGIVKKGEALIGLDDFNEQQALSISKANLTDTEIRLKNAKEEDLPAMQEQLKSDKVALDDAQRNFDRSTELAKTETITRAELEQAENKFKTADSKYKQTKLRVDSYAKTGQEASLNNQLALLKAKVEIDRKNLEDRHITAPYDCLVVKINTKGGEKVKSGAVLMTVIEKKDWVLETDVDQKELPYLKLGLKADILFDAYPSEKVKAEINFVCASIDMSKGTCSLKLVIKDRKAFIKHGMTGNAEIRAASFREVLAVPSRFIGREGRDLFCFIKEKEGVKKSSVFAKQVGEKFYIADNIPEGTVLVSK